MNDAVDVVNAFKEGRFGGRRPSSGTNSRAIVQVRNSTGADRARGEVVQLVGHLLDDVSEDHPWFDSDLVAEPILYRMAILTRALKEDEIGPAQMAGVCLIRVNVTDTDHTHATPVDGDAELESSTTGPLELLMNPDGTGVQDLWALIDRSTSTGAWYGKLDEDSDIDTGATVTVSLYSDLSTDTGDNLEVYNLFGDGLTSTMWVAGITVGSINLLIAAPCPA